MPSERAAPYRLTLLGPWDLRGPDGEKVRSVLSQPKRLCLLAYLALCAEPVSRATLVALFWPESDEDRARNALSQALHYLRRSLGPNAIESVEGDRLLVSPEQVWFDARVFLRAGPDASATSDGASGADAISSEEIAAVAEPVLRGREFFQGWNAEDSQPLQEWLDGVRGRVRERGGEVRAAAGALEAEASRDEASEVESSEVEPSGEQVARTGRVDAEAAAPGPRVSRPRRVVWISAGLVLGALVAVAATQLDFVTESGALPPASAVADEPPAVAVLLPRVTTVGSEPGLSATALAEAIHEELVAEMWHLSGVQVVPVGFESDVWRLVRSLEAQGADHMPEWVVSVGIRMGGRSARVVAQLRSGPDYGEISELSRMDYPVPEATDGLIRLPAEIAAAVVGELMAGWAGN